MFDSTQLGDQLQAQDDVSRLLTTTGVSVNGVLPLLRTPLIRLSKSLKKAGDKPRSSPGASTSSKAARKPLTAGSQTLTRSKMFVWSRLNALIKPQDKDAPVAQRPCSAFQPVI